MDFTALLQDMNLVGTFGKLDALAPFVYVAHIRSAGETRPHKWGGWFQRFNTDRYQQILQLLIVINIFTTEFRARFLPGCLLLSVSCLKSTLEGLRRSEVRIVVERPAGESFKSLLSVPSRQFIPSWSARSRKSLGDLLTRELCLNYEVFHRRTSPVIYGIDQRRDADGSLSAAPLILAMPVFQRASRRRRAHALPPLPSTYATIRSGSVHDFCRVNVSC